MKSLELLRNLIVACCVSLVTISHAQNVSYEAFKISTTIVSATWESTEKIMPSIILQLESELKTGGMSEKSVKIFSDEFRREFNKDNFSKLFAEILSRKLSVDEQKQTLAFLQSSAGAKYMELLGGKGNELQQAVIPLIKRVCESAKTKLGISERGSLSATCGQF
ncbi:MAG: hypothetical protein ACKOWD_09980 [Rhodoferax sp.]